MNTSTTRALVLSLAGITVTTLLAGCSVTSESDVLSSVFATSAKSALAADFISGTVTPYIGTIPANVAACRSSLGQSSSTGSIRAVYNTSATLSGFRGSNGTLDTTRIVSDLSPMFRTAVQNNNINWRFSASDTSYTFIVSPGDETLWYCYLTEGSTFMKEFLASVEKPALRAAATTDSLSTTITAASTTPATSPVSSFVPENRWAVLTQTQRETIARAIGYTGVVENGKFNTWINEDSLGNRRALWRTNTAETLPDGTQNAQHRWGVITQTQRETIARSLGYTGIVNYGEFAAYLDTDTTGAKWQQWNTAVLSTTPEYSLTAVPRWNILSQSQRNTIATALGYTGVVADGAFARFLSEDATGSRWTKWKDTTLATFPSFINARVMTDWAAFSQPIRIAIARSIGYQGEVSDTLFTSYLDTANKWDEFETRVLAKEWSTFEQKRAEAYAAASTRWNLLTAEQRTKIAQSLGYTGTVGNGLFAAHLDTDATGAKWTAWKDATLSTLPDSVSAAQLRWNFLSQAQRETIAKSLGYTGTVGNGLFAAHLDTDATGAKWTAWQTAVLAALPDSIPSDIFTLWDSFTQAGKDGIARSLGFTGTVGKGEFARYLDQQSKWTAWVTAVRAAASSSVAPAREEAHFQADNRWKLLSEEQRHAVGTAMGYNDILLKDIAHFYAFLDQDATGARWTDWKNRTLTILPTTASADIRARWDSFTKEQKTSIARSLGYNGEIAEGEFARFLDAQNAWAAWAQKITDGTVNLDQIRSAAHATVDKRWALLTQAQRETIARSLGYTGSVGNGLFAAYLDTDTTGAKWTAWQVAALSVLPEGVEPAAQRWQHLSHTQRDAIATQIGFSGTEDFGIFARFLDEDTSGNRWRTWSTSVNATLPITNQTVLDTWGAFTQTEKESYAAAMGYRGAVANGDFSRWLDTTSKWDEWADRILTRNNR